MSDLLRIGSNSLSTFQSALTVIGQNIANVSTPCYSRRVVNFSEAAFTNGVNLGDVQRVYSETASLNLQAANSSLAASDIYLSSLQNLESLFDSSLTDDPGDPISNSISRYLSDMINSLNQTNASPQSTQARQLYLMQLQTLTNRFNQMSGSIQLQQNNVNAQLVTDVGQVNQFTQELASINVLLKNASMQDTSALLDQQENLLQQLAGYLDFQRTAMDDGEVNITLSNGISLVLSSIQNNLVTLTDPTNPGNQIVYVNQANNNVNVNDLISGGDIGGLLSFRDDLAASSRGLGRLALGLASAMNTQNKLGVDYYGNFGLDLFNNINDTSLVAARALAYTTNTGTANVSVTIQDITQMTTSDYTLYFDSANHYQLTRIDDGSLVSSGSLSSYPATITADGMSISISADTFNVGDTFTLSPTNSAASSLNLTLSDPASLALAFPVTASAASVNQGSGTIEVTSITNAASTDFSTPLQLNPPIVIQFLSATSYQIVNANNNTVIEGPISYNNCAGAQVFPTPGGYDPGYRVTLTGAVSAGDKFNIQYNTTPSGDNRNGRLMADLFNQGLLDNGTNTLGQAYNLLSSNVSSQAYTAQIDYQSAGILVTQTQAEYDAISGVSLEEETVNLAEYQQAYQACAQILETARTIFDTLLQISRGAL